MNSTDTKFSEIRSVPETSPEPESITISLTETEAEVIANYIFSKYTRLEDIGLHDSKCCIAMCNVWHKIKRAEKGKANMKEFMNEILVYVKDEFKEVVESELNRVREDFNFLTDEEKDNLSKQCGFTGFVFDDLEKIAPNLKIKNTPIQLDLYDVLIDPDEDEEYEFLETYEVLDMIVDYCTRDKIF